MIEQNENSALKSKLLTRIIIAVSLIVVAILVLTLVEHFSSSTPPQKVAPPAPTAPSAPLPKLPPKPVLQPKPESAPVPAPQAASIPAAEMPPEPVVSHPVETPPPPSVHNVAPEAKPKKKAVERKKPVEKAAEKVAKKRHEAKKTEIKGDFALQFGVFSSSANSEKMVSMLKKKGLTPSIDYRVLAGSYPDKASAEKEKKALGGNPVALAKGYTLQIGDFSSRKHAEALAAELKKKGVNAVLEARIRAGRYASRNAALEEAKKLGIAAIAVKR